MDGSSLRPAVTRAAGKPQTRFAYPIAAAALPHDGLKSLLSRPTMTGTFTETYIRSVRDILVDTASLAGDLHEASETLKGRIKSLDEQVQRFVGVVRES